MNMDMDTDLDLCKVSGFLIIPICTSNIIRGSLTRSVVFPEFVARLMRSLPENKLRKSDGDASFIFVFLALPVCQTGFGNRCRASLGAGLDWAAVLLQLLETRWKSWNSSCWEELLFC
jgi:hypothetical protein